MKTGMQKNRTGKEAIFWNAVYHTTGMGVIKKGNLPAPNDSGFGVIKKIVNGAENSDPATMKIIFPPLEMVVDNSRRPDDIRLRQSADRILIWMKVFPKDAVKVDIKDGWMTLTGKVDWRFQRDVTIAAISSLYGIKGYTDEISILYPEL